MPKDSPNRLPALDGLRAISIVMVIAGHVLGGRHGPPGFKLPSWLSIAGLGVNTFFVISGFLITTLLVNELDAKGKISLKDFYIRRAYRIFPAAYVYIAVMIVLAFAGVIALGVADVVHAVTYTTNYRQVRAWNLGHLWSLSVEEQFYLLWPAIVAFAGRRRSIAWAIGGILLGPVSRVAIYAFWPSHSLGVGEYFPTVCDGLATGCLFALVRPWLGEQRWYTRFTGSLLFWTVPLAAFASLAFLHKLVFEATIQAFMVNLATVLLIDRCVRFPDKLLVRVLDLPPFVFVGTLSYSLYLWQQPFASRTSDAWIFHFPQGVIAAFLAALASYDLVEKPVLRLRARRAQAKRAAQT